jgi:hypothetical protein
MSAISPVWVDALDADAELDPTRTPASIARSPIGA